jgi:hypothetical protein
VTDDASAIDKLTSKKATELFNKINLTPIIPPDLRAKRTIFVRQLDKDVGSHSPAEIKHEITTQQNWLQIQDIIKIKHYTHVIKIITTDTTIAQRILTHGFYMYNTKITPLQCEQEHYTHLLICYKCYKFEDHPTHQCTSTTPSCSECAAKDHTYTQCTNTYKKCLNCQNDHRTLAANCPYRKQKIQHKQQTKTETIKTKTNQTYVDIAKQAIQQTSVPQHSLTLTDKNQLKLTAIILEAHIASLSRQEGFGTILSKSLKANYDIDATFPDRDSAKIFNFFYNTPETKTSDTDFITETEFIDDDDLRRSSLNLSQQPKDDDRQKNDPPPPKPVAQNVDHDPRKRKSIDDQFRDSYITIPGHDDPFPIKLFRSSRDKVEIPPDPSNLWYAEEFGKKDYGLKLSVKDVDSSKIIDYLKRDKLKIHKPLINIIPHEIFTKMDKHSTTTTKRTKHSTFKHPSQ